MSLVNDLLIELDRQESERNNSRPSGFKESLAPDELASARGSRPRRLRTSLDMRLRTASRVVLAVAGGAMLISLSTLAAQLFGQSDADGKAGQTAHSTNTPPAVSARVPDSGLPDLTASESGLALPKATRTASSRIERETMLHALVVGRHDGTIRLRLEGDPEMAFRIEHDKGTDSLSILLLDTSLAAQFDKLDLGRTPIRSLETDLVSEGIHLSLDLDAGTEIESHALATPDRKTLFIDFERSREESDTMATSVELDSYEAESPIETPARSVGSSRIVRSNRDHARQSADSNRRLADDALVAARSAAAEGDSDEALEHFSRAIGHSPGHREALIAWAELMSERGELAKAVEGIRKARRTAPKDIPLAMLHARLLERAGEIESAIALLEGGGFSLTEAPEIHGLIAAYLQRAGQHDDAVLRYKQIVQRYPGESRWWMGLGISLEATERAEEAAEVYRIAMQTGDLSRASRQWVSSRVAAIGAEG